MHDLGGLASQTIRSIYATSENLSKIQIARNMHPLQIKYEELTSVGS